MKTSIVILTYNKLDYTKLCINSIRKFTHELDYEIIVVDNNSTDGTIDWLKEQKDINCIFNEENMGFPKGCNQGIEIASGDNILLLNNDVVVTHNWLQNLLICLYSSDDIGAVGSVTNNCSNYQTVEVGYNSLDDMFKFAEENNKLNTELWEEKLKLVGYCMLIKKSVVDKIGLLDEIFTPGNYEDDDYSYRIRQAGYRLMLCKDTFIHHFGSTSFKDNAEAYTKLLNINKQKFESKWGFDPEYSSHIRYDLIEMMDLIKNKPIRVLEVGCACGATLLAIKNIFKDVELYGIEINKDAAKMCGIHANVKTDNIEKLKFDYEEEFFDFIIFGDVLEHLYEPEKVLIHIKRHLKSDGKILASIPNVMHYTVMWSLLNGNWTYEDAGILDRTHIRFYTLNEIKKMFSKSGYSILQTHRNILQYGENEESFMNCLSSMTDKDMTKEYETYQYVLKVCKEQDDISKVINNDFQEDKKSNDGEYKLDLEVSDKKSRDLTFLLRRIENDILFEESVQIISQLIINKEVTIEKIIRTVDKNIINKEKVLESVTKRVEKLAAEMGVDGNGK